MDFSEDILKAYMERTERSARETLAELDAQCEQGATSMLDQVNRAMANHDLQTVELGHRLLADYEAIIADVKDPSASIALLRVFTANCLKSEERNQSREPWHDGMLPP